MIGKRIDGTKQGEVPAFKQGTPEKPLITIITIVYNDVDNIEKTINSVINQTYENIEYIIVDGASTDGTLELIKSYRPFIDTLISEKDNGISDAFNKGTLAANGQYINYMNSGDSFVDNTVVGQYVEAINDSYADIVTSYAQFVNKTIPKKAVSNKTFLYQRALISHQASFISKDVFNRFGLYDLNFRIRMDYEFWLRVLPFCNIKFIDSILIDYLDGGISGENYKLNFQEEIKAQIKNLSGTILFINLTISYVKFFKKNIKMNSL